MSNEVRRFSFSFVLLFIILSYGRVDAQTITDIPVQIDKKITSKGKSISTEWCASVSSDVYLMDTIIIRQGTPVAIRIERAKARPLGEEGTMTLRFLQTTDVNGRSLKLQTSVFISGRDREALAIGLGLGLGFFTIVGYFCFLVKGTEAVVNPGTLYYVRGSLSY